MDDIDSLGGSITSLGDLDGDGGTDRGAAWVLFMKTDGTVKGHQKISSTEGNFSGTLDNDDRFGTSVATLGDLNGDGISDLAVGARHDDDGGTDRGAVWILSLDGSPLVRHRIYLPLILCSNVYPLFVGCAD